MRTNNKIYVGVGSVIVAGILFLFLMDSFIMPAYTNYNEGVTVPKVSELSLADAEDKLTDRGLRFEVAERRSNEAYPADYVIDQTPDAANIVKPNRKIYLTVNTEANPTVTVPDVVDLSLRNARIQLSNTGLRVGTVSFESSRFKDAVLRQSIPPQTVVPQGESIDLSVSDGLGEKLVTVPDIKGLRLSEAQQELQKVGLRVEEIEYEPTKEAAPNIILDYSPQDDQLIQGETLKLIVSERFGDQEESETGATVDTTGGTPAPDPGEN
ncbi:PASTA domain-containing protein [Fodinibius sp.]|uniref:PASTA domain-containing protein n=1 Tax=Fodinibius sp. TaxID=1872440 RepID=UPI0035643AEE